ncbi:hypothetical protein Barb6_01361 [Bacteroidales bacterium Barb6]|nr:hypothetical protein Barb6_01361 [Bacteroidales bacterium Barb6]
MQVKRSGPTSPLYFRTSDGWDTELLYAEKKTNRNGHSVTTYHNRPTVVVLDPFNHYIVGYAIGTNESTVLIRQAYRNAMEHVQKLFGGYYKPWQIQSDNYQKKNLTPFYQSCTEYYTPAAVGNAKAKVIEPFFHRWNDECFRIFCNSSGYGVKSQKFLQPSEDFIERNKAHFPNWNGVVGQIENAIAGCRAKTREAYVWIYNLIDKAQQYKSTFNIPEKVLTNLVVGRFAWSTAYLPMLNPATHTPKLIQAKVAARKALEGLARDLLQGYLVHSKEMTGEIRVDFDLRIPRSHSTIPRPTTAPSLAVHSNGLNLLN